MARLAKTVVAARENMAVEAFKNNKSIPEVNEMLLKYDGMKMAYPRLVELQKSVQQEIVVAPANQESKQEEVADSIPDPFGVPKETKQVAMTQGKETLMSDTGVVKVYLVEPTL